MTNKNKELFQKQLNEIETRHKNEFEFEIKDISKELLENLFSTLKVDAWLEYFYDSEPDYDEVEFKMHMDYLYNNKQIETGGTSVFYTCLNLEEIREKKEDFKFSENEHTLEELKKAHEKIEKERKAFEETRLTFNNWVELHEKGNWEASQNDVQEYGKETALALFSHYKKGRWAKAENDESVYIFFYGRDVKPKCDFMFIFDKERDYNTKENNDAS